MLDMLLEYISTRIRPSSLLVVEEKRFTIMTLVIRSIVNLSMVDIEAFSDVFTIRSPRVRIIGKTNSSMV